MSDQKFNDLCGALVAIALMACLAAMVIWGKS